MSCWYDSGLSFTLGAMYSIVFMSLPVLWTLSGIGNPVVDFIVCVVGSLWCLSKMFRITIQNAERAWIRAGLAITSLAAFAGCMYVISIRTSF